MVKVPAARASLLLCAALGAIPLACAAQAEPTSGDEPRTGVAPERASQPLAVEAAKTCAPGETLCGKKCVFLASDKDHCGACDESCSGGTCSAGQCTIASGLNGASTLAIHGESVYFSDQANVRKASVDGGGVKALAAVTGSWALAVDDTNVYWTDLHAGTVNQVPLDGGSTVALASGQNYPWGLTIDRDSVYFSTNLGGTVSAVPKGGGALSLLASALSTPTGMALQGKTLFFAEGGGEGSNGVIAELAGSSAIPLATSQTNPTAVATDAVNVYWVDYGDDNPGSIVKMPLGGGVPVTLAAGMWSGPISIAVDATYVYVALNVSPGGIACVPIAGGTLTMLATSSLGAEAVAVDGTSVYWAADDTIMKMPKP